MKTGNVAADQLQSYINRIELLESEKADIGAAIKDVYAEAKSNGFDAKAMRQVVKLRKKKASERMEEEFMLDLYLRTLGMQLTADESN